MLNKNNRNNKEINKIAGTVMAGALCFFGAGSILTYFMCFAASAGLSYIVNDFIVIYIVALFVIAVSIFCISRSILINKEAYHFWLDDINR